MLAYDPTSAAHSLAAAPNRGWTVEEVAHMQAQDVAARAPADGGDSIGVPAPPAAAASGGALADVMQRATVSGRYRGAASSELELRVDVDGVRPTRRVSGDFFRRTGGTLSYVGSFVVSTPNITVSPTEVVIEGEGVFTFPSGSPRLRVTIPRVSALAPRPAAAAQFLTPTGIPGTAFTCAYESAFFRTVEFEQDSVQVPPSAGAPVDPFESYDTGRLASGGPARVLTVAAAYAEAGIEIVETGGGAPIEFTLAGPDRIWTDSELHAAMVGRFSRYTPDVAWRVWLLAATRHEDPGLRGVMFDSARRQGCAVFHDVIGGGDDRSRRAMLRTYMHELGHCFNLYHSHEKSLMVPPQPNRLDALSWMQYPDYYTASSAAGALAYWRAFPFQFDDEELTHLRHGFRSAVVPGANAFGRRAADVDPDTFADTIADESGLAFELRAPERFLLGTPVVVELKLSVTDLRGRTVNRRLHPNFGFVQIGIRQLGGSTVPYRPLIVHCAEPDLVTLDAANGAVYDSAYIGFGKDGFYFDNPGQYELRALYTAPDGSTIVSNVLRVRVKPPASKKDEGAADLFLGTDQGTLLYLLGSEGDTLRPGRDAFDAVLAEFGGHPLASYARLVKGMNASRAFKKVADDGRHRTVSRREPDLAESEALLSRLVESSLACGRSAYADGGSSPSLPRLDNISLEMAMRRLAQVREKTHGPGRAAETAYRSLDHFANTVNVPPHVLASIADGARRYLSDEDGEALTARLRDYRRAARPT